MASANTFTTAKASGTRLHTATRVIGVTQCTQTFTVLIQKADIIDVFEALDMYLPGMFAYRSVLAGGIPMSIPNLRNKEERNKWRNDTACCNPETAGDMLIPSFSLGNPEIPDEVYKRMYDMWQKELSKNSGHTAAAFPKKQ